MRCLANLMGTRSDIRKWLLALAFTGGSILVRFALEPWLNGYPFLAFFPVVAASTILWGWRPGILVLFLTALAGWYFFTPLHWSVAMESPSLVIRLSLYLTIGGCIVVLAAASLEMNRQLRKASNVQEALFHELQHRVANSMELVELTLDTARRSLSDAAAVEVIDQTTARIGAMAQLHRRLNRLSVYSNDLGQILRDVLAETFRGLPVDIRVNVRSEGLSIDQMMAILLLVNEAAINATKGSVVREQAVFFEVSLLERPNGLLRLTIRHSRSDAIAEPAGPAVRRLDPTIMQAFARQLGGTIEVPDGPDVIFSVEFPRN